MGKEPDRARSSPSRRTGWVKVPQFIKTTAMTAIGFFLPTKYGQSSRRLWRRHRCAPGPIAAGSLKLDALFFVAKGWKGDPAEGRPVDEDLPLDKLSDEDQQEAKKWAAGAPAANPFEGSDDAQPPADTPADDKSDEKTRKRRRDYRPRRATGRRCKMSWLTSHRRASFALGCRRRNTEAVANSDL